MVKYAAFILLLALVAFVVLEATAGGDDGQGTGGGVLERIKQTAGMRHEHTGGRACNGRNATAVDGEATDK